VIFTYTAPGRLESPEGYVIVRSALGWEVHHGESRLGRPWVTAASGHAQSLRDARRHAEAHQRFMAANSRSPGTS
jgi:hypothetical protein